MPAVQRGALDKRGRTWRARYRDENGQPRSRSGFPTKSEAGDWLDRKLGEVEALRRAAETVEGAVEHRCAKYSDRATKTATRIPPIQGCGGPYTFDRARPARLALDAGIWVPWRAS